MSLTKIRKVKSGANIEQTLNQIQDSIIASVNPLLDNPVLNSNIVENVKLVSTEDNVVAHGLGRTFSGYIATRIRNVTDADLTFGGSVNNPTIYESTSANNNPDKFVILNCSANMTANILFF